MAVGVDLPAFRARRPEVGLKQVSLVLVGDADALIRDTYSHLKLFICFKSRLQANLDWFVV